MCGDMRRKSHSADRERAALRLLQHACHFLLVRRLFAHKQDLVHLRLLSVFLVHSCCQTLGYARGSTAFAFPVPFVLRQSSGKSLDTSSLSFSGIWPFSTRPSAPHLRHSSLKDRPLSCVMIKIRSSGRILRSSVAASSPFIRGMLKSLSTRSGTSRCASATSCSPSRAVPEISNLP